MNTLPNELICIIYSHLDCCSIRKCCVVNKHLYNSYKYPKYDYMKKVIYDCNYWLTIRCYQKLYENKRDHVLTSPLFLENHNKYEDAKMHFVETITLEPQKASQYIGCDIVFVLPMLQWDNSKPFAYKKIRFDNYDYSSNIDHCELEYGGMRHQYIDGTMFKTLRHIYEILDESIIPFQYCSGKNWLPSINYHECRINVKLKSMINFNLLVDIWKLDEDFYDYRLRKLKDNLHYKILESNKNINIKINKDINSDVYHFDGTGIVTHLIFDVPEFINIIKIVMDNKDFMVINTGSYNNKLYTLNHPKQYNGHYIIPITKNSYSGINFSNIKEIKIITHSDKKKFSDDYYKLYTLSIQRCTSYNGMFWTFYSS